MKSRRLLPSKQITRRARWLLSALTATLVAAGARGASSGAYDPIRLHPENPRYFFWRGQPTVLIGASEHKCAVVNAPWVWCRSRAN